MTAEIFVKCPECAKLYMEPHFNCPEHDPRFRKGEDKANVSDTAPSDLRETLARVAEIRRFSPKWYAQNQKVRFYSMAEGAAMLAAVDQLVALIGRLANLPPNCWEHEDNCCYEWCDLCEEGIKGEPIRQAALADARLVRELLSPERGR